MKLCPRCSHRRAYALADRRRKCRSCGFRYSWTSAWDSIRLPEAVKRGLLKQFAIGVPAYRLRGHTGVSSKSHERFNRVLRAACAHQEGIPATLCGAEWSAPPGRTDKGKKRDLRGVLFEVSARGGRVRAAPCPPGPPASEYSRPSSNGPLEPLGPDRARVFLELRGARVVCADARARAARQDDDGVIDRFCHFTIEWLQPYGSIRREYFHLYVGEACYRFNNRGAPLESRIRQLMRKVSIQELRPLLVR